MQAPTAIRESAVTGAYLGLCPVLKEFLDRQPALHNAPPGSSLVLAGISAGLFAALITQPFDTAKTRMQAFVDVKVQPLAMLLLDQWHLCLRLAHADDVALLKPWTREEEWLCSSRRRTQSMQR